MKKISKKYLVSLFLAVSLPAALYVYIQTRTGPDYTEHFARILPPETAAFVSLMDLTNLWNQTTSLKATGQILESDELSTLLVSSRDIRKWKHELGEIQYQTRMNLGKELVLRWFGQDAALALMPPLSETAPPALCLMSKTRIGFEEKFAEFIALYYPDLQMDTRSYKGVDIRRYRGEKPRRSFCYIRFGRTVILSLRSPDSSSLEKMIDLKKDDSLPRLHKTKEFRHYLSTLKKKEGLSAFIQTRQMMAYLKASQKISDSGTLGKWLPCLDTLVSPFNHILLDIHIEKGLFGKLGLYYEKPLRETPPAAPTGFRSLSRLSGETAAFLGIKDPQLQDAMRLILNALLDKEPPKAKAPDRLSDPDFLEKHLLSHLKNEIFLAVESMDPGILSPLFHADLFLQVRDPQKARGDLAGILPALGTANDGQKNQGMITPLGWLGYAMEEDFIRIYLRGTPESGGTKDPSSHLGDNPLYQSLLSDKIEDSKVVFYINFERVSGDLEDLAKGSIKWNEKTRERVDNYRKWAAVCRYLHGLAVYDKRSEKAVEYDLILAVE
jgi:hypothetical protein